MLAHTVFLSEKTHVNQKSYAFQENSGTPEMGVLSGTFPHVIGPNCPLVSQCIIADAITEYTLLVEITVFWGIHKNILIKW